MHSGLKLEALANCTMAISSHTSLLLRACCMASNVRNEKSIWSMTACDTSPGSRNVCMEEERTALETQLGKPHEAVQRESRNLAFQVV